MKTKDKRKNIVAKSPKDLQEYVKEKREAVREIRFKAGGAKVANVREIRATRRDIARALTILAKKA